MWMVQQTRIDNYFFLFLSLNVCNSPDIFFRTSLRSWIWISRNMYRNERTFKIYRWRLWRVNKKQLKEKSLNIHDAMQKKRCPLSDHVFYVSSFYAKIIIKNCSLCSWWNAQLTQKKSYAALREYMRVTTILMLQIVCWLQLVSLVMYCIYEQLKVSTKSCTIFNFKM